MNDDAIKAFLGKIQQSDQAYAKAMEMIAVFSAGTIGVIVALRPMGEQSPIEIKVCIITLFIAILCTIVWFMGKGVQYRNTAGKIIENPDDDCSASEPWWARACRVIALSTFVFSYWLLLISL